MNLNAVLNREWLVVLERFTQTREFLGIIDKLRKEKAEGITIYPETPFVFRALNLCSFNELKVILAAQDPYHSPLVADGLAFSCGRTNKPQPSLKAIISEIEKTTGSKKIEENNYSLEYLAKQGILLINSSLTVQAGNPNSHKLLWKPFIDYLFQRVISKKETPLAYILLGNESQSIFKPYARKQDAVFTAVSGSF